jgi:ankyrin repeat protein
MQALLLKIASNINIQDNKGQTALHYVCSANQTRYLHELLRFGIDTTIRDYYGMTASEIAEDKGLFAIVNLISDYEDFPSIKEPDT